MKKCILFLLLLGVTNTRPFSISITDTAYWFGTIAAIHWVCKRIERIETLQEAQIKAHNKKLPIKNNDDQIPIPQRPTLMGSAQELATLGRCAVSRTVHTANGLHTLSNTL